MHPLLQQSKRTKSQANAILKDSGIIQILQKYGTVDIHGSYALDLMWKPDIDLIVVRKKHDWKKLLKVSEEILDSKYFKKFVFSNAIDFKGHNGIPCKGYFLQGWKPIGKLTWKVDIWIITPNQLKAFNVTSHFKKLLEQETNDSKKELIIQIKKTFLDGMHYTNNIEGKNIYEAVLEKNIKSVEAFKQTITPPHKQ